MFLLNKNVFQEFPETLPLGTMFATARFLQTGFEIFLPKTKLSATSTLTLQRLTK